MIALLCPPEHLEYLLAQLELLYNIIGWSMGCFACAGMPWRVVCGRAVLRAASLACARGPFLHM